MKPFLVQVIQRIQEKHRKWDEVVIILPSKRAGVYFNHYLLENINSVQLAPAIYSIESFVEEISSLKKATQTTQLFTLYAAYKTKIEEHEIDDFATFLLWGKRLLNDFNDLDAYRINPDQILKELGEFYRIEAVFSEEEKISFPATFWENLPQIYHAFEDLLLERNSATLGMLYKDCLDSLELYLSHTTKTHYFIGFNALNKAEQDIFQEFLVEKKGEIYWDLDQYLYESQYHAAGRFIRNYQKKWPYYRKNPLQFTDASFSAPKKIKATGFSGNIVQAHYVGDFLKKKSPNTTTAVVLGNEQLLIPVLSHLPIELDQWNVTMGYAIDQLPFAKWFITVISMHAQYKEDGYARDLLLKTLSFAPFKHYVAKINKSYAEMLHDVENNYRSFVPLEELKPLMENHFINVLLEPVDDALQFIDKMNALLIILYDKSTSLDEMSSAVLECILNLLIQIRSQLESISFEINIKALFVLLKESITLQTLDFKGDPINGIQLMGMLESRVLDFDRVIITNVNEGILPVGKNDQSFFPFSMKKEYGLPTFLDNDAIYTYHFYRLIQRAKEVHLLYNAKSEGLNAGEKSRFIRQLELLAHPQHSFSEDQYVLNIPKKLSSLAEVKKTSPMLERLAVLAQKGFSPTSLGAYLLDPLQFYQRYILGIKELELPNKVLSHLTRGTIVHDCIEELYVPYLGQRMQSKYYDKMLSALPTTLKKHYEKVYPKTPTPEGENYLILKAYQRGIMQFFEQEKALVEAGNILTILDLEKEFAVPLNSPVEGHKVIIRGKIDRIDRYNGKTRLIDYKTGTVEKAKLNWQDWQEFKGDYKKQPLFQLLLYAWAYLEIEEAKGVEVGIISFKSPKSNVLPLIRKALPKEANQSEVDHQFAEEIGSYLTALICELFDLEKSFVSLGNDN